MKVHPISRRNPPVADPSTFDGIDMDKNVSQQLAIRQSILNAFRYRAKWKPTPKVVAATEQKLRPQERSDRYRR
jgi:hypothetical protein